MEDDDGDGEHRPLIPGEFYSPRKLRKILFDYNDNGNIEWPDDVIWIDHFFCQPHRCELGTKIENGSGRDKIKEMVPLIPFIYKKLHPHDFRFINISLGYIPSEIHKLKIEGNNYHHVGTRTPVTI